MASERSRRDKSRLDYRALHTGNRFHDGEKDGGLIPPRGAERSSKIARGPMSIGRGRATNDHVKFTTVVGRSPQGTHNGSNMVQGSTHRCEDSVDRTFQEFVQLAGAKSGEILGGEGMEHGATDYDNKRHSELSHAEPHENRGEETVAINKVPLKTFGAEQQFQLPRPGMGFYRPPPPSYLPYSVGSKAAILDPENVSSADLAEHIHNIPEVHFNKGDRVNPLELDIEDDTVFNKQRELYSTDLDELKESVKYMARLEQLVNMRQEVDQCKRYLADTHKRLVQWSALEQLHKEKLHDKSSAMHSRGEKFTNTGFQNASQVDKLNNKTPETNILQHSEDRLRQFGLHEDQGTGRVEHDSDAESVASAASSTCSRKGERLIPKAEGSIQESEAALQIGLAARNRLTNQQSDISIVEEQPKDCIVTRQVKAVIRRMTHVCPDKRAASEDAEKQLNSMCLGIMLERRQNIPGKHHSICLSGQLLVIGGESDGQRYISAVEVPTGKGQISWWANCSHFRSFGPLVPFGSHGQFILESCQACQQIRRHDVREKRCDVIVNGVAVSTLCTGSDGTILCVLSGGNTIVQLAQVHHNGPFEEINRITSEVDHIVGLQYFQNTDTLVLAGRSKLQGILLSKEKVLWRWNDKLGNIPLSPRGVMRSFPGDWLCVANGNGVLIIKPDGALCEQILNKENICSVAWCYDVLATLSIDGTITIYNITYEKSDYEYPCC